MRVKYRTRLFVLAMAVAVGAITGLFLTGAAAAQDNDPYSNDGPRILPSVIERDVPERPDITSGERRERGPLPFTGADLTLFVATGMAAVATGSVIVRRSRSRNEQ